MAHITRYPVLSHLRSDATVHVQHWRNGRPRHAGRGLAFWFRPRAAALAEVPLDDREQTVLVHARTVDFQDVTVQATVTYRVTDPVLAATRIDFDIAPETGQWRSEPLEVLGGLLAELVQQPVLEHLAARPMADALAQGVGPVRDRVASVLADDPRLAERGLAMTDVRVVAVRADPEMERALQTGTREQVQQEADRATYERRALAVERERAIGENELQSQIELARREEELVAQRGANARRQATEQAAADRIATDSAAEQRRVSAAASADATRLTGQAEGEAEAARLAAYAGLDQATLVGLSLRELAANLPEIGHLTLTPDLLTPLLTRLAEPALAPVVTVVGSAPADGPAGGDR